MSGADLTDFFLAHKGKSDQLLDEIQRLSTGEAEGRDEVQIAVEQMLLVSDDAADDHILDMLTDDEIMGLEPPSYVADGWTPKGFYTDFYGAPGAGKTFALLDLVRHVRAGAPWHGNATRRGGVLFYQGEGLQQLQERIRSWDQYHPEVDLAPGRSLARFVDLSNADGVAAVIRTAQRFESATGVPVVMIAFDPAVEFMTGDENGDGMELLTRGLRTIAQYLNIAVVVGHHTNASGDRARGTDHMRMRSGAHVRVERMANGDIALVQEKQKNGEQLALILSPSVVGASLVLETKQSMTAVEYASRKSSAARSEKVTHKLSEASTAHASKATLARELLMNTVREQPGISQSMLLSKCKGRGVGNDVLLAVLDDLLKVQGVLRIEVDGTSDRAPHRHYLVDGAE